MNEKFLRHFSGSNSTAKSSRQMEDEQSKILPFFSVVAMDD